jgi:hypothetical protein
VKTIIPDWIDEEELQRDVEFALKQRLIEGSRKAGVKLTAQECRALLAILRPSRRAPGRPRADYVRTNNIAMYSIGCEWRGASATKAVEATAKKFKLSHSTVWAARKLFDSK